MKSHKIFSAGSVLAVLAVLAPVAARAVYAPIPEEEQGKVMTYRIGAGMYHDTNLFASNTGQISSYVRQFIPEAKLNLSVTDQTFVSAGYKLTADYVDNRPGTKAIASHDLSLRVAHSFAKRTTLDVYDFYSITKNPQSLLAGVALNTDQSFRRNELGARFSTGIGDRALVTLKANSVSYGYDNPLLAASIDHNENLFGVEGSYELRAQLKLSAEYRYQLIDYSIGGATKDKQSHFFLAGVTYTPSRRLTLTVQAGGEDRVRSGESDTTTPYAELRAKYDYGPRSYVSGGYAYTLEETSNVALYSDTQVSRFFVNVQHQLTGSIVASGSLNYEPSQLQGRATISPDRDDTTTRFGLALTWVGAKNWTLSATYDYDKVSSQDNTRDYTRARAGVSARYTF